MNIKDPSSRLMRWRLRLEKFDYTIQYKKGTLNNNADSLSRRIHALTIENEDFIQFIETYDEIKKEYPYVKNNSMNCCKISHDGDIKYENEILKIFNKINTYISLESANYTFVISQLSKEEQNTIKKILTYLKSTKEPRIAVKDRELIIPSLEKRFKIIKQFQRENGHLGTHKVTKQIGQLYTWPFMQRDITNFINKCKHCQLSKRAQYNIHADGVFIQPPSQFNERIAIDHLGPSPMSTSGNKYLLTIQDQLTKFLKIIPVTSVTGEETAEAFVDNYVYDYGAPQEIIMDNAKGLQSEVMKTLLKILKIKPVMISAGHPQSNGSLERAHNTIKEQLRIFAQDTPEEWDKYVKQVQYIFNTMENRSIGMTPLKASFNKDHHLIEKYSDQLDKQRQPLMRIHDKLKENFERLSIVRRNLEEAKRKYEEEVTKKRKGPTPLYKIGDKIMVKCLRPSPLTNPWAGPYIITNINPDTHTIYYQHKNKLLQRHINETQLFLD